MTDKQLIQTKPKVIIGQYYQRPLTNHVTAEGRFWQSVYLGEYQRGVVYRRQMIIYCILLVGLFSTLAMVL